ncbi:hypothetical protein [Maricaulis maris]|uniref:hypothetical protein n=1 Tax=Maricaulis maris TaxID=74318 RepID=UPI002926EB6F|nr:hypothetical protein MACH15_21500 [Maricaulis maris]
MTDAALKRYIALNEALAGAKPKPDTDSLPFTASALLRAIDTEADPGALAERTRQMHEALKQRLGQYKAPTGPLRWVYAAMMVAQNLDLERFLQLRDALQAARKASGTGHLFGGGSRAALILSLSDEPVETLIARFFAIKQAIRPPWWRADVSVTDTFAAAHAAEGASPTDVAGRREQARAVFKADRVFKSYRHEATRLSVLLHRSPHQAITAFEPLREAVKAHKALRHGYDKSMLVSWAVEGLGPDDIRAMAAISDRLPRKWSSAGSPRTRLAHQILTAGRPGVPGADISAMAAVIAAQTAVMVAIMSSTMIATTSVTTS